MILQIQAFRPPLATAWTKTNEPRSDARLVLACTPLKTARIYLLYCTVTGIVTVRTTAPDVAVTVTL